MSFHAKVGAVTRPDPDSHAESELVRSCADVPLEDTAFLRAVIEAVPGFVLRLDPEQRVRYINCLRPGYALGDIVGRPVRELISGNDLPSFEAAVERALRTGLACDYRAGGSLERRFIYEGRVVPIDEPDGRRAACIIAMDVTQHVERAEALRASEENLRLAVEATGIALWTWDLERGTFEWSERMREIADSPTLDVHAYIERVVHPDDRSRMAAEVAEARRGQPRFPTHRIVRPDGEVRWVMPCGRVVRDEAGRVLRIHGGTLDITAQRATDERLREAQKMEAVGSLTAGVAHNFNNMLAVIVPALERASARAEPADRGLLADALDTASRATELVAALMTFTGRHRALAQVHDVSVVLERALTMCRRTFDRRIQIEAAIDSGCAQIACDPAAIEQVVVNLLINARDAVMAGERIDARIQLAMSETDAAPPESGALPARYLRICVEDNGVGMSDSVKRRLFEPFFTTKALDRGKGLGLATSYGIVRDHGGFITISSEQARGTTAEVFLPVVTTVSSAATNTVKAETAPRRGRILVVDDERAVRRAVELLLSERGHEVTLAHNGKAAIAALDSGPVPDLILLDRSMPGWPVELTLAEIRKRAPAVPIVFFTGQEVTADERAEVQDVLYKPLAVDELVQSIERWL